MRPARLHLCCFSLLLFALLGTFSAAAGAGAEGSFAPAGTKLDPSGTKALLKEGRLWDSWSEGISPTGRLTWGPFTAGDSLELALLGFPGRNGQALALQDAVSGERLSLRPRSSPNDKWTRYRWNLPDGWKGRQVLLVADDTSDAPAGWMGVSTPLPTSGRLGSALLETSLVVFVWALLLLPGFCLLLLAGNRWAGAPIPVILAGSATTAYAVFFCYFALPAAGSAVSYAVIIACALVLLRHSRAAAGWLRQPGLAVPLLLSLAATVLYFLGGFLYGGTESPHGIPIDRFLVSMPPDPVIPHWFAYALARGEPIHPFFADWLTSDRPPLQTCLNLLLWPVIPVRMGYQAVGMAAQCWVWLGLWFFLERLRVPSRAVALVFAGALFSGFFFLNTVFCWPKLLPAAFLLCVAGLLWSGDRKSVPPLETSVLAAACMAFAFLGHGGSLFGGAAIVVFYLAQRRPVSFRFIATTVIVGGLLMAPWFLYQRFVDPPGDRLIKYHMAGHEEIDPRSSLTVIREAYARAGWGAVLHNKVENAHAQFFGNGNVIRTIGDTLRVRGTPDSRLATARLAYAFREGAFFHYVQALGPLLLGLPGLLLLLRRPAQDDARCAATICAGLGLVSAAIWCLLMFKGGSAVVHQSSYFTGACLFTCAGIGLAALPRRIASAILAANFAWFLLIWVIAPQQTAPGELLPCGFGGFWLLWWCLAIALFAALHLLAERTIAPPTPPSPGTGRHATGHAGR